MSVQARVGGAWKTISRAKVRVNGAWRNIVAVKCLVSGNWVTVGNFTSGAGTISLAISPSSVSGSGRNTTVGTSSVRATPTGGQTPYTYAWNQQSGDAITVSNATSAITSFQARMMSVDEVRTAVFRCTCTDSLNNSDFEDVTVTITRLPPLDFDPGNNNL